MSKHKHTPGPWKVGRDGAGVPLGIVGARHQPVVTRLAFPDREQHEANARLIATAPEMLEAGKQALECIHAVFRHHGDSLPGDSAALLNSAIEWLEQAEHQAEGGDDA